MPGNIASKSMPNVLPKSPEDISIRLETARRQGAVSNVSAAVRANAKGVLVHEISEDDYAAYHEAEERGMEEFANVAEHILSNEVIPAIREYLTRRFPERMERRPRKKERKYVNGPHDFTTGLSVEIVRMKTRLDDILRPPYDTRSDRLANYSFDNPKKSRKIRFFLEDVLRDYPDVELDEAGFRDFVFQVFLHEMVHSASTVSYMAAKGEP